ncbi:unnamed protein product [Acanthosepion pharaonis]|uniref:Uncharacterized protein n=1 Tax=Acanthosepion pharaonis TaxID=158019 RepID=A0A812B4D6_ACAPH|nr:unnamed protein product [Sepia pharaonis]
MCRFSDMDSEVKSQLITGCLSEKVRQKGLMNSDMSLHDLINYARTTETIASHLQTMRLEDNNIATATTAPINKVADEQRQPSNYPRQYQCKNCNGKYPHERGPTSCPLCLLSIYLSIYLSMSFDHLSLLNIYLCLLNIYLSIPFIFTHFFLLFLFSLFILINQSLNCLSLIPCVCFFLL